MSQDEIRTTIPCSTCTAPATCRLNGCVDNRPDEVASEPSPELLWLMREVPAPIAPYNPWPVGSRWWNETNRRYALRKISMRYYGGSRV